LEKKKEIASSLKYWQGGDPIILLFLILYISLLCVNACWIWTQIIFYSNNSLSGGEFQLLSQNIYRAIFGNKLIGLGDKKSREDLDKAIRSSSWRSGNQNYRSIMWRDLARKWRNQGEILGTINLGISFFL